MHEPQPPSNWKQDLAMVCRGIAMGAADVVPGVSGGTVALVLGIYRRLVTAISHVDLTLLGYLGARQWRRAAQHIDLRFCLTLGLGIGTGILALAKLMKFLLTEHPQPTLAVFFGLIAASGVLVARMVGRWTLLTVWLAVTGAVFAFWLTGLLESSIEHVSYGYLFVCGMVAICAMILPGISGSFILLILGLYHHVIGKVSDVAHGAVTMEHVTFMAVFAAGCLIGLLGFSKVLRMLLTRYESATMAVLCGFMFGSLRKVWPFQVEGVAWPFEAVDGKLAPTGGQILWAATLAIFAAAVVLLVDGIGRRMQRHAREQSSDLEHREGCDNPPSKRNRETVGLK